MNPYKERVCVEEIKDSLSVLRDPTAKELEDSKLRYVEIESLRNQIKDLKKILTPLEQNCPHTVIFDTEGFPYNSRYCAACGSLLAFI